MGNGLKLLIMAGGSGTRMNNRDKFLLPLGDSSILGILMRTLCELHASIYLCTVKGRLEEHGGINIIQGSGEGYVQDMNMSLSRIGEAPILVIPGDTVILNFDQIRKFLELAAESRSDVITFMQRGEITGITLFKDIPADLVELSYENIEAETDCVINVNTPYDYRKALDSFKMTKGKK